MAPLTGAIRLRGCLGSRRCAFPAELRAGLSPVTWDHPSGPDFFTRPEFDGLRPLRDRDAPEDDGT